jgi:beta-lactamase superfamily II metal-dependent hydrolase
VHRRPIVLATHVDSDHIAGLIPLVSQVPLAGLLEATPESTATLALRLREAYAQAGLPMAVIGAGDILYSGRDWSVRVLHPARAEDSNWERDPATAGRNQDSVVLHVRYGQFSALLMGDAPFSVESDLLDRGLIEPVTVLRLGHHGSRTSSHPTFLDRAQPALAVVSCGRDNSYGHPSRQVLEWLQERSIPLARTDLHGAIRIETDGENWRLSTVLQTQEDKVPKQGITLPRDSEHIADPLRPLPGVQVPSLN